MSCIGTTKQSSAYACPAQLHAKSEASAKAGHPERSRMGHSRNSFSSFLFFHCIKEVARISISRSCRDISPSVTAINRYVTSQTSLSIAYQTKNIKSTAAITYPAGPSEPFGT